MRVQYKQIQTYFIIIMIASRLQQTQPATTGVRTSGMLRGVDCWLVTDVSGQPIGPIFNITNHQLKPRNIPGVRRP